MSLDSVQTRELVQRASFGDLRAFDVIVKLYRPGVLVLARQIVGDREKAEDVVQDSFLASFKSLPQLNALDRFPQWLGSIVRNTARRHLAGETRECRLPLDNLILDHAPSLQSVVESYETDQTIRNAVMELSEDLNLIVQLYYFEGWKVDSISAFLGLPVSTVKWRLNRSRQLLRNLLSPTLEEDYESNIRSGSQ